MKKTLLTSLIILSQVALAGCDSREKDTLTLEVAVADLEGKTQNFKMDCKHMSSRCSKIVQLHTPNGEETFRIGVVNGPTENNYEKLMAIVETKTTKEVNEGAFVLSEYSQKIIGMNNSEKLWKPGSTRTESFDLALRDGTKVGSAEVKVY